MSTVVRSEVAGRSAGIDWRRGFDPIDRSISVDSRTIFSSLIHAALKKKADRFRQLDSKPNREMRQHAAAPYFTGVFTHNGLPLGGLNRTIVGCFVVG